MLDEAAWMANSEELWQALAPSITASGEHRLSVLSTPREFVDEQYSLLPYDLLQAWSTPRTSRASSTACFHSGEATRIDEPRVALGVSWIDHSSRATLTGQTAAA